MGEREGKETKKKLKKKLKKRKIEEKKKEKKKEPLSFIKMLAQASHCRGHSRGFLLEDAASSWMASGAAKGLR